MSAPEPDGVGVGDLDLEPDALDLADLSASAETRVGPELEDLRFRIVDWRELLQSLGQALDQERRGLGELGASSLGDLGEDAAAQALRDDAVAELNAIAAGAGMGRSAMLLAESLLAQTHDDCLVALGSDEVAKTVALVADGMSDPLVAHVARAVASVLASADAAPVDRLAERLDRMLATFPIYAGLGPGAQVDVARGLHAEVAASFQETADLAAAAERLLEGLGATGTGQPGDGAAWLERAAAVISGGRTTFAGLEAAAGDGVAAAYDRDLALALADRMLRDEVFARIDAAAEQVVASGSDAVAAAQALRDRLVWAALGTDLSAVATEIVGHELLDLAREARASRGEVDAAMARRAGIGPDRMPQLSSAQVAAEYARTLNEALERFDERYGQHLEVGADAVMLAMGGPLKFALAKIMDEAVGALATQGIEALSDGLRALFPELTAEQAAHLALGLLMVGMTVLGGRAAIRGFRENVSRLPRIIDDLKAGRLPNVLVETEQLPDRPVRSPDPDARARSNPSAHTESPEATSSHATDRAPSAARTESSARVDVDADAVRGTPVQPSGLAPNPGPQRQMTAPSAILDAGSREILAHNGSLDHRIAGTGGIQTIRAERVTGSDTGAIRVEIEGEVLPRRLQRDSGVALEPGQSRAPNFNVDGSSRARMGDLGFQDPRQWERLHLWGPGFGDEAAAGVFLGPSELNQVFQNRGVERSIRELADRVAPLRDDGYRMTVRARAETWGRPTPGGFETSTGEPLVKAVSYEVTIETPSGLSRSGRIDLTMLNDPAAIDGGAKPTIDVDVAPEQWHRMLDLLPDPAQP